MEYRKIPLPTKGKICKAIYIEQQIPNYVGNPLIEALPRIMTTQEAMKELAHYPEYDESMRQLPDEIRQHILPDIVRFFTPMNIHIDLERRFSRVIRTGYIERNPLKAIFWKENVNRAGRVNENAISQYDAYNDYFHSTSAYGFNMVGISGIGKSLAAEVILRLCPQVIHHSEYKGRKFTFSQIVWLKIDCPFDGSLKGLCINFFQTVDSILGTSYHKHYVGKSRGRTTDEMLLDMALVAANHGIGVLVIDEIQRVSLSKSGGVDKMLNFFDQLVNTMCVPVILVGTYKSLSVFDNNFSQMRRGTGQGDLVWDRMQNDKEWKHFVKVLWRFQYTRNFCSLDDNPELIEVLYEETQGITDLAVKAYMLAQERAIESKKELITASIIRSVCRDKFKIIRPALDALKGKTKNALAKFEDAYPKFLEEFIKKSEKDGNSVSPQIEGEISSDPVIRALRKENKKVKKTDNPNSSDESSELIDEKQTSLLNLEIWLKKSGEIQNHPETKAVLPAILSSLDKVTNESIYAALNEAGFIRSGSEFMSGGEL